MERREAMKFASVVIGGTVLSTPALAQKTKGMAMNAASVSKPANASAIATATAECARACEICIAHCQALLAKGDTMLADCLKKCLELVPLCDATGTLANYGSALTGKTAKVCLEACEACAESCKPHTGHHAECKACYEACLKCIEACRAA